ncbi:hypothetical protein FF1_046080 [Malus domestica]
MAESAVKFLLDKVAPFFENDLQLLGGFREEIVYLRGELERLTAFLRVADAFEESDEEVKVWVKQVRDIAHDSEDVLDEFTLLQAHDHGKGLYSSIHKFSCCIKNMKSQYRIAAELQGINSRIRNISEVHRRLSHKFKMAEQGSGSSTADQMWGDHRGDALLLEKTDIVGIVKPIKQMVGWLVSGGSGRQVVSVAGMGGLGKTTLAKQVYDAAEVKKHFKVSAWVTVTQSLRLRELLKDMIQQLHKAIRRPVPQGTNNMNNNQLKTMIKAFLQKRSRVILTTRKADVASTTSKESGGRVFNLEPLPQSASQLRSLFMFGVTEKPLLQTIFPGGFRLLSVLDLQSAPLNVFPVEAVNLFFLKYLSLKGTRVKTIPKFIGKLQNLETLDLKHSLVTELPVEILKLQHLRHLLVYRYEFVPYGDFHSKYGHSKYGFKVLAKIGALTCLQKLCFIEANQDGGAILRELGKLIQLRRLGIVHLRKQDGKALCLSIDKLTKLCALSITSVEEDEIIDLQHISSPPLLLQRLYLRGRLETLPHWIPSLHSLVRLYLKWSRLKDNPLVFIQHLPNLVHLELSQVFEGDTLCFGAGGYKKLKHLGIDKFDELRCIEVQEGAMPFIEKLSIQRCKSLEKVPSGIEHLNKLKVLEFFDMPETLIKTLSPHEQGNDYWKVAHIPEVYFTYLRESGWEVYTLEGFNEGENFPQITSLIKSHELESRWK